MPTALNILTLIGTLPGVVPVFAGGRCGPGVGAIRSDSTGTGLAFRAPGSGTFGLSIDCAEGGSFVLVDGEDASSWLEVTVYADYLPAGAAEAAVRMTDRFDDSINTLGLGDVTASEAATGDWIAPDFFLRNQSGETISNIRLWLDPLCVGLSIDGGGGPVAPISEADAVSIGDLAPGGVASIVIERDISSGSTADPDILNHLHVAFDGNTPDALEWAT